ncbi:hypothetical protein VDGL01_03095 [Verticillium dahliae]
MNIYEHDDCTGAMQEVNVWDNTCAAWMMPFNSVMLIKDGTWKQKARFCPGAACLLGCQKAWAVSHSLILRLQFPAQVVHCTYR